MRTESAVANLRWAEEGVHAANDTDYILSHYVLFHRLGRIIGKKHNELRIYIRDFTDQLLRAKIRVCNEILHLLLQNLLYFSSPKGTKKLQDSRYSISARSTFTYA